MRFVKLTIGIIMIGIIIWSFYATSTESEMNQAREMEGKNMLEPVHKEVIQVGEEHPIRYKIDKYIQEESLLKEALAGISIRSAETGDLYYEYFGNKRFSPASNMKLLTGAVALQILGENHTFSTEVLIDGEINEGTLDGNLYIRGKGDPTLLPETLAEFARKVKETGITQITGDVIADDTWYDDVRLSRDLNWDDEEWYYGAQVSALTVSPNQDYDAGSVIVTVSPATQVGEPPTVTVFPENGYVKIQNDATTVSSNSGEKLTLRREHGKNIITIEGDIAIRSSSVKEWMAVWEPTGYVLSLFTQALKNVGITWDGTTKLGKAHSNTKIIFTHQSMPLSELFIPFMKLSNNGHAEIFLKEMGKRVHGEGSWEKGIEVVESTLREWDVNVDRLVIRDGSGISHINMLVPNEVTKLLFSLQDEPWFSTYKNSLPITGIPDRLIGGTLNYRMPDLSVQAKTGTIAGAVTLSGYVDSESGERYIFSIMLNHLLNEEEGLPIIDQIVQIISEKG